MNFRASFYTIISGRDKAVVCCYVLRHMCTWCADWQRFPLRPRSNAVCTYRLDLSKSDCVPTQIITVTDVFNAYNIGVSMLMRTEVITGTRRHRCELILANGKSDPILEQKESHTEPALLDFCRLSIQYSNNSAICNGLAAICSADIDWSWWGSPHPVWTRATV